MKMSPCSVWARKKNMDLVLWVAEQTNIMPRSGSSRSFCRMGRMRKKGSRIKIKTKHQTKTDYIKNSGVGVINGIVTQRPNKQDKKNIF